MKKQQVFPDIKTLSPTEQNELMRKLYSRKTFFLFYFDMLPNFKTQTECFDAVNLLHYNLFGEEKYSSYDSFRRRITDLLNKKK